MASIEPIEAAIVLVSTLAFFILPLFIIFPPIPVEKADALGQTHAKLGVPFSESRTEESKTRAPAADNNTPTVHSLWVFPIKSCQGIELARAKVCVTGIEYDRLYTLAQLRDPASTQPAGSNGSNARGDGADKEPQNQHVWEFITLRQFPLMATVKVDLWVPDATKHSRQLGRSKERYLVMRFPWHDPGLKGLVQTVAAKLSRGLSAVPEKEVLLPVDLPADEDIKAAGWTSEPVRIWRDTVHALNLEKELPPELRLHLGVKHRLAIFRMDPTGRREIFRNAPRKEEAGYQPVINFHDGYPINLMNIHSVQDLNARLPRDAQELLDLDFRRFRANIIVSGVPAFEEETWKHIGLKDSAGKGAEGSFYVVARSVRCRLPNVHPTTGVKHDVHPDKALRAYRDVDEGAPKSGCLGMQLCGKFADHSDEESMQFVIEAGMRIDVTETGEHVYIST